MLTSGKKETKKFTLSDKDKSLIAVRPDSLKT